MSKVRSLKTQVVQSLVIQILEIGRKRFEPSGNANQQTTTPAMSNPTLKDTCVPTMSSRIRIPLITELVIENVA
jgi:hypothetical protein